jgi:hypothetical protein
LRRRPSSSPRRPGLLGASFVATADPAIAAAELSIGEASLAVPPQEAAELYSELVSLVS